MEEGEEEQDISDWVPGHASADTTMGKANGDKCTEEACPTDALGQMVHDAQKDYEIVNELEALHCILDDHAKLLCPDCK